MKAGTGDTNDRILLSKVQEVEPEAREAVNYLGSNPVHLQPEADLDKENRQDQSNLQQEGLLASVAHRQHRLWALEKFKAYALSFVVDPTNYEPALASYRQIYGRETYADSSERMQWTRDAATGALVNNAWAG